MIADLLPINVREAAQRQPKAAQRKTALDLEHNVVIVPEKTESEIVRRLREALIAEWIYAPQ